MTKTIPQHDAERYAAKLKAATTTTEIDSIWAEIESTYINQSDSQKTKNNKLAPLNQLMKDIPVEELKLGENAFTQLRKDGTQWIRHYYFKASGIADVNWWGKDGLNTKSEEKKFSALVGKKEIKVAQYIETTIKLLQSNDAHEIAVGLIAASGRRPIEILSLAKFTLKKTFKDFPADVLDKVQDLNIEYYVNFSGQAKRDEYHLSDDEKLKYPIGLLVPTNVFMDAFKKLRSTPESLEITAMVNRELASGISYEEVNAKVENYRGNSLRRVARREFDFLPPKEGEDNVCSKSLRAAYVKLITERDCPKSIDDLLWASRSVGHFVDTNSPDKGKLSDLLTTLSYRYYYVDSPVPFAIAEKKQSEATQAIHVFKSDVAVLDEIQAIAQLQNRQQTFRYILSKANKAEARIQKADAKIAELESKISELETLNKQLLEEKETMVITPVQNIDADDLKALIKEEVDKAVEKAVSALQLQPATPKAVETAFSTSTKDDIDWQSKEHEELWKSKAAGASTEKIRRSFNAIADYNDTVATGDNDRIAITNQALRDLSGCNGLLVRDWIEKHRNEIISHNAKYGMENKKDPSNTATYANKGKDTESILSLINEEFLNGEAFRKAKNE